MTTTTLTTANELARLERVELRTVWTTEAQDFTPWLALPENLAVLSAALNMELETAGQEERVGPFRADLLCRDLQDDSWVLIENQLERTDHNHLGQLLTYAAGLQTVTIIWVAQTFTDEHRAALDWLNEITDAQFRFFGLEIELWRIGDSPAAPKFNIIAKPNSWSRTTQLSASGEVGPAELQQQRFWGQLSQFLSAENKTVRLPNPPPRPATTYGLGRTGFLLWARLAPVRNRIQVELRITGGQSKAYFALLEGMKGEIESEIADQLEWAEQPARNVSRIILARNASPTDEGDWPSQIHWFADTLEKFKKAFQQRVNDLNASDWQLDDEIVAE